MRSPFESQAIGVGDPRVVVGDAAQMPSVRSNEPLDTYSVPTRCSPAVIDIWNRWSDFWCAMFTIGSWNS